MTLVEESVEELAEALRRYVSAHGGFSVDSPIDIVFSEYDVVQPDIVLFSAGRANLVDLDRVIRHAPDLCVEILSPSTEAADRGRKMQMFARYGVPEYWIVDPQEERITVLRLSGKQYVVHGVFEKGDVVTSHLLPGFGVDVRDAFAQQALPAAAKSSRRPRKASR